MRTGLPSSIFPLLMQDGQLRRYGLRFVSWEHGNSLGVWDMYPLLIFVDLTLASDSVSRSEECYTMF